MIGSMNDTMHFEWLCDVVVDNAQTLIRNSLDRLDYKYKPNKADFGSFRKFFEYYQTRYRKKRMSDAFLIEYMNKQFDWMMYRNEVADNKLNKVRLSWFFGAKAIERWEKQLSEKVLYNTSQLRSEGVALEGKSYERSLEYGELHEYEERERSRFHNTEAGLFWCIDNTYLFHSKSIFCKECEYAEECKAISQENFPKIYEQRK